MAGSKENASAKEIRDHLQETHPEMTFISRKPTNRGALVIEKETGRVWLRGDKNYEILAQLTDPGLQIACGLRRLLDVPATINIKSAAENHAREIIGHFNELVELMGSAPILVFNEEDSYLEAIRYPTVEFTVRGRKER